MSKNELKGWMDKSMIKVRVFDKTKQVEFAKLFVNEWSAIKFIRKVRHSNKLQIIGEMEYVSVSR